MQNVKAIGNQKRKYERKKIIIKRTGPTKGIIKKNKKCKILFRRMSDVQEGGGGLAMSSGGRATGAGDQVCCPSVGSTSCVEDGSHGRCVEASICPMHGSPPTGR